MNLKFNWYLKIFVSLIWGKFKSLNTILILKVHFKVAKHFDKTIILLTPVQKHFIRLENYLAQIFKTVMLQGKFLHQTLTQLRTVSLPTYSFKVLLFKLMTIPNTIDMP